MAAVPPDCNFGEAAHDFRLPSVDGKTYTLGDVRGRNGTVVLFMCNHCPYVKAIVDRLIADVRTLHEHGVSLVAINSNDASAYPADSFEHMQRWSREKAFPFPYLQDESQKVARAYGAVCTPDFFGYDKDLRLRYRGRLDEGRTQPVSGVRRELVEAMIEVARTGEGPSEQTPSMGCSIKWKQAA